ncbi:MAG: TetR/AcrR family transcriptional regulator [Lachnospiraceae bacterium]|nr:TetR/AcrR family transcriptional regulator [Lachnospiraceae bacterium]
MRNEAFYEKISVTELCRMADINRGTFYLHYLDLEDVLDQLLKEILENTTGTIEHVMCGGQECKTYPFCQRMHSDDRYRVLFMDDGITEKLLHILGNYGKEDFISYLMSHSHLNFQEAEAIYTFQINGCLAINRLMLYNKCSDWQTVQKMVDAFLKAGLEHFLLPDREPRRQG